MTNCKQCDKPLTHVEGRKQKMFCDNNCKNKYFYAERQKLIKAALATTNGNSHIEEPKESLTDTLIPLPDKKEAPVIPINPNEKRIKELQAELKNPPKNPLIGLRRWIAVRENELKELQKHITP